MGLCNNASSYFLSFEELSYFKFIKYVFYKSIPCYKIRLNIKQFKKGIIIEYQLINDNSDFYFLY